MRFFTFAKSITVSFIVRKAKREDSKAIHALILELAIYEKAEKEMTLTLEELESDGFGQQPIYEVIVAEEDGHIIGMALYYEKYSTWKGRCIYLEDLIVTQVKRGIGAGKALFQAVIKVAKEKNCGRMEWQVLDWNAPSIEFYKSYGAELDSEWINGKFRREQLQQFEF